MRAIFMGLVIGGVLLGCQTSAVDQHFGDAQRESAERMVANPEAAEKMTPVEGVESSTARDILRNYHENQQTSAQSERQKDSGLVRVR